MPFLYLLSQRRAVEQPQADPHGYQAYDQPFIPMHTAPPAQHCTPFRTVRNFNLAGLVLFAGTANTWVTVGSKAFPP